MHEDEDDHLQEKDRGPNDFVRGMLAEMHAYRRIFACKDKDKSWLMDLHGVIQDENSVLFVMVSPRYWQNPTSNVD